MMEELWSPKAGGPAASSLSEFLLFGPRYEHSHRSGGRGQSRGALRTGKDQQDCRERGAWEGTPSVCF